MAFVDAVWAELEAAGPTDFARKLGLGPDGLQKIRRWRDGGRLDYEDVMVMLERTGWFLLDGTGRPAGLAEGPGRVRNPLEDIAENQAAILENQKATLQFLELLRGELGIPSGGGRTAPKRQRHGEATGQR